MAAALWLVAASAAADITKDQCVDANAKAQDLRRDGKLSAQGAVPPGPDGYANWDWSAGTDSFASMSFY